MKRTILLIAVICNAVMACGQNGGNYNLDSINLRNYDTQYLLPEIMNNCNEISLDVLPKTPTDYNNVVFNNGYIGLRNSMSFGDFIDIYESCNLLPDFAQPYRTDTSITIIGLSGYLLNNNKGFGSNAYSDVYDTNYKFYLELWDSSLTNIIRSVDVTYEEWTTGRTPTYTEVFFDNPVNINGKFYIVYHTPDSVLHNNYKNFDLIVTVFATIFCNNTVGDMYPLRRYINHQDWEAIWANQYDFSQDGLITMLYLFPILSEYNPDAEEWHGVGLNETRDISNFTHVFPNPAKEEVNINCGYKIKSLQVYDEQGKVLLEKEVNAYNYQINLNPLPQGTYFIKVITNSGQTVKKIILSN